MFGDMYVGFLTIWPIFMDFDDFGRLCVGIFIVFVFVCDVVDFGRLSIGIPTTFLPIRNSKTSSAQGLTTT